jgi:hypothetical protein
MRLVAILSLIRTPHPILSLTLAEPKSIYMQADYANLKRLQNELEKADAEMKTAHCNRMVRYIK